MDPNTQCRQLRRTIVRVPANANIVCKWSLVLGIASQGEEDTHTWLLRKGKDADICEVQQSFANRAYYAISLAMANTTPILIYTSKGPDTSEVRGSGRPWSRSCSNVMSLPKGANKTQQDRSQPNTGQEQNNYEYSAPTIGHVHSPKS